MRILIILFCLMLVPAYADTGQIDAAIAAARASCRGISNELADLKRMAGINTAVTAVGTAAGVGATAVGIIKANTDKELRQTETVIAELESMGAHRIQTQDEFAEIFGGFLIENGETEFVEMGRALQAKNALEKKSKNLGNWRTGLMAGATATNVAGTIIAARNKVDDNLQSKIAACIESVNQLQYAYNAMRVGAAADAARLEYASRVIAECGEWRYADLSVINNRARGATISSGVGAGVGLAGTIVSAIANTDKTRGGDETREKNLNTAANIMAGTTTVASGVATVFNATQIGAIKRVAEIADKCQGVLQ